MRVGRSLVFFALFALAAAPVFACKILVMFPEHLAGGLPDWPDAYVVEIAEAHEDRIVGRIVTSFGGDAVNGRLITFYFRPDEEAHAVCETPFEIGETHLVFSTLKGHRREISRFNWMNVPKSHEKFPIYVEDLQIASAAGKSREHRRDNQRPKLKATAFAPLTSTARRQGTRCLE